MAVLNASCSPWLIWVSSMVVIGLVTSANKGNADECRYVDGEYNCTFRDGAIALSVLQNLGASAPAAGLVVPISKGHRPAKGWLATGYIIGALSILSGAVYWYWGNSYSHNRKSDDYHHDKTLFWVAGIPHIVLGVSNIVMASYGLSLPVAPEGEDEEGKGAQLSFAPLVAPDGQGGYYSGIGINVVGW